MLGDASTPGVRWPALIIGLLSLRAGVVPGFFCSNVFSFMVRRRIVLLAGLVHSVPLHVYLSVVVNLCGLMGCTQSGTTLLWVSAV